MMIAHAIPIPTLFYTHTHTHAAKISSPKRMYIYGSYAFLV